jgi:hypothetical protein
MYDKNEIKFISLEEADKLLKFQFQKNIKITVQPISNFSIKDSILLLLSAIDYNKSIISRTLFMKEVFLFYEVILKNIGLSIGAREAGFFEYKYGPYSIDVNVVASGMIFSGILQVKNFYEKESENEIRQELIGEKNNRQRFLAVFKTNVEFDNIAKKYEELLMDKGYSINEFRNLVSEKKKAWDQSGPKGITRLLQSEGFKNWYNDVPLEHVFPEISFGKIREDALPRGRRKND